MKPRGVGYDELGSVGEGTRSSVLRREIGSGHVVTTQPTTTVVACCRSDATILRGLRDLVTATLKLHGWEPERIAEAQVLVSELATNAVLHAGTELEFRLVVDDVARMSVTDRRPERQPHVRQHDLDRPGGLGLRIVSELAQDWGVHSSDSSKTVWCELEPS